jgi:spore coat protein JB
MNKNGCRELLQFIYEVSFAIDDVVLYLDTHPTDQRALDYYEEYRKLRKQAVAEYTECCGPLTNEDVNTKNYWTWVAGPWPWEGEC